MKLDEVEPGVPLLRVRIVPEMDRDALSAHVLRYVIPEGEVEPISHYLHMDGGWKEYQAFEIIPPLTQITGPRLAFDPLTEIADELTQMIVERVFKEHGDE